MQRASRRFVNDNTCYLHDEHVSPIPVLKTSRCRTLFSGCSLSRLEHNLVRHTV